MPAVARARRLPPIRLDRLARFAPSRRSLLVGLAVLAVVLGGYAVARETSLFAIHRIDIRGGSAVVDAQVAHVLAPFVGKSLVGLDGGAVLQRIDALPTVVGATYDRAFPNTLRVTVVPEQPVAVLRSGARAWIVSGRGRVIRTIAAKSAPALPRIWEAEKTVRVGETLPLGLGGTLARALAVAGPLRGRVGTASITGGQITFQLRSGISLVLGAPTGLALKTAVAVQVLQQMPSGTRTVDVSVPSRPVTNAY